MSTAEELRERIRKFTQKAAELLQQENFQSARAHQEQVKILQTQLDLQKQLDLTGWRPPKQTVLWFRAPGGKATQVHISGNKLDVARMRVSAGLTLADLLPVMRVRLYSPATDIEGLPQRLEQAASHLSAAAASSLAAEIGDLVIQCKLVRGSPLLGSGEAPLAGLDSSRDGVSGGQQ